MAYTQADLDNIDAAIATGTLRVTIEGRSVEYRSLDDLIRIRGLIAAAVQPVAGRRAPLMHNIRVSYRRGF